MDKSYIINEFIQAAKLLISTEEDFDRVVIAEEIVKIANLLVSKDNDWKSVKNDPGRQYKELPSGEKEYRDTPKTKTKVPSEEEVKKVLKEKVREILKEKIDEKPKKEPKSPETKSFFSEAELSNSGKAEQPNVKTKKELFAQASEAQDQMLDWLDRGEGVDKKLGLKHYDIDKGDTPDLDKEGAILITAPVKGEKRAEEKVNSDFGGDWSKLTDAVRASIAVDSFDDIEGVMKTLRDTGMKLATKPTDRFANPTDVGYRDIKLNVEYPNGHVGELQVHLKSMIKAKEEAHKDYEVVRSIAAKAKVDDRYVRTNEEEVIFSKANERMTKTYSDAWGKSTQKEANLYAKTITSDELKYYVYRGSPSVVGKKKYPVAITDGKFRILHDTFKFQHEAEEISEKEYDKMISKSKVSQSEKKKLDKYTS